MKSKANYYLKEFPNEIFQSDGTILFFSVCEEESNINKSAFYCLPIQRTYLRLHLSTSKIRIV